MSLKRYLLSLICIKIPLISLACYRWVCFGCMRTEAGSSNNKHIYIICILIYILVHERLYRKVGGKFFRCQIRVVNIQLFTAHQHCSFSHIEIFFWGIKCQVCCCNSSLEWAAGEAVLCSKMLTSLSDKGLKTDISGDILIISNCLFKTVTEQLCYVQILNYY